MDDPSMIASIDIGAAFTRCAYVTPESSQGRLGTFSILQFPTYLLISPQEEFDSFGESARDKYLQLLEAGKHTEWFYFKAFKSHLYGRKIDKNSKITDVNGREFSALSVFKMTIEFAVCELKGEFGNRNVDKWVITVPSAWRQQAKQLVLQAALLAGLSLAQTVIALDTEAAAIFCQKELDIKEGSNFIVCDLGDIMMDVAAFAVKNDGTLEEFEEPQHEVLEFSPVCDNLLRLAVDLLGKVVFEKLRKTKPDKFYNFIAQFTKRHLTYDENGWSFEIPQYVLDIFKENFKNSLNEKVKNQYREDSVTFRDNCLILSKEKVRELFVTTATSIEKNLCNIFKSSKLQDITKVYLVGGQTQHEILISLLEASLPDKKIFAPSDSTLAVVKGSVMYSQHELSIPKRRLKFTYGVLQSPVFKIGTHDEKHAYVDDDGVKRCLDCFVSLATKGQLVGANEVITKTFRPQGGSKITTQLADIYQASGRSPKYVSDSDCEYLGSTSVLLLDKSIGSNKDLELKMWFGRPLVTMEAKDNATQKVYNNVFHCLNEKKRQD